MMWKKIFLIQFLVFSAGLYSEILNLKFVNYKEAKVLGFDLLAEKHYLPLEISDKEVNSVILPLPSKVSVKVFVKGGRYRISLCIDKMCFPPKDAGPLWYPQFVSFKIPWEKGIEREIEIKAGGGKVPKWICYRFSDLATGYLKVNSHNYYFAFYSNKEDGRFEDENKNIFLLDIDKDGELIYSDSAIRYSYEKIDLSKNIKINGYAFKIKIKPNGLKAEIKRTKNGIYLTTGLLGSYAPEIFLKSIEGEKINILDLKPVFIYFLYASPYMVQFLLRRLESYFELFKKSNIEIAGVIFDGEIQNWKVFLKSKKLPGKIFIVDGELKSRIMKVYHLKGIYDIKLIGKDGKFWPIDIMGKSEEEMEKTIFYFLNPENEESKKYLEKESKKSLLIYKINLYTYLKEWEKAEKLLRKLLESFPEIQQTITYRYLENRIKGYEVLKPVLEK